MLHFDAQGYRYHANAIITKSGQRQLPNGVLAQAIFLVHAGDDPLDALARPGLR
jgi:hypothetical protein